MVQWRLCEALSVQWEPCEQRSAHSHLVHSKCIYGPDCAGASLMRHLVVSELHQ